MTVDKTFVIKGKPENKWILVDARDAGLGRLATQIAFYLLGKHKPTYTPGVDMGDFVVVVNAGQVKVNSQQMEEKWYHHHSGYPGGLKSVSLREQLQRHPDRVIHDAVWGMLPHNKIGHKLIKRLKVYAGSDHPHQSQNPQSVA